MRANKKAGYSKRGYIWHHHHKTKGLMQLVEENIHKKTGHTGGFKHWLILFKQGKSFGTKKLKYLLLDGTKWDCGTETIHLMTLCVLVDDVAIPIWWEDLAKAGHSSQEDRIAMFNDVMNKYKLRHTVRPTHFVVPSLRCPPDVEAIK